MKGRVELNFWLSINHIIAFLTKFSLHFNIVRDSLCQPKIRSQDSWTSFFNTKKYIKYCKQNFCQHCMYRNWLASLISCFIITKLTNWFPYASPPHRVVNISYLKFLCLIFTSHAINMYCKLMYRFLNVQFIFLNTHQKFF